VFFFFFKQVMSYVYESDDDILNSIYEIVS